MTSLPLRRPGALFLLCLFLTGFSTRIHAQWAPQADSIFGAYFAVQALQAVDSNTVWAGASTQFYGSVPTLYPWVIRSADGGANWSYDTIPFTAGYLMGALDAPDAGTCRASLIWFDDPARNRLYQTADGGLSWQLQLESRSAGGIVHFFDAQHGVVLNGTHYQYTDDGGASWSTEASTGLPDSTLYLPLAGSYATAGDTLWVTTVFQQLLRSTDKGHSWGSIALPFLLADEFFSIITFAGGQNGMAASPYYYHAPRLFSTSDGGLTWSVVAPPQTVADETATVEALAAIPGQPGWYLLQCTDFNLNLAQTYLTKDNGASWVLKDGLEALNYAAFALDFVSDRYGWVGLNGFPIEQACVYRWNTPLGFKGTDPSNAVQRPATGKPAPAIVRPLGHASAGNH